MQMWLTERDMKLINWINRIGFVTIEQIVKWLGISAATAYIRLRKLTSNGYLVHERVFHGVPGIYRVTLKGKYVSCSELPPLRRIRLGTYHHDLAVVDLSFILLKSYGGRFIYERELRHQDGEYEIGKKGHTSDGLLVLEGNKKIAIEVELTRKGKRRLDTIRSYYIKCFNLSEIWYFCGNAEVEKALKTTMQNIKFIKFFPLNSFLL